MLRFALATIPALLACVVGCGSAPTSSSTTPPSAEAGKYLLAAEPGEARSVSQVKEKAEDGDEVTLVGRIGGSTSPFVAGRASFTVVDTSLLPCNEKEDDACTTPWDYCCDTDQLPANTVVVKLVDEQGKTLPLDAKEKLGMKELQTIVVKGKAKRDEAGNLTVLAPALYVRK